MKMFFVDVTNEFPTIEEIEVEKEQGDFYWIPGEKEPLRKAKRGKVLCDSMDEARRFIHFLLNAELTLRKRKEERARELLLRTHNRIKYVKEIYKEED